MAITPKKKARNDSGPSQVVPNSFRQEKSYAGLIEGGQRVNESDEDRQAEEIERNGYTILEGVLGDDELNFFREMLDGLYHEQIEKPGERKRREAIGDDQMIKLLMSYDEKFMKLATKERILALVRRFLGDVFILHWQTGIFNSPSVFNPTSEWHRDLVYQHYTSSKPLAMSALCCVDDFSEETGGTLVLSGSHRHELFPSQEFVEAFEVQLQAKAGSFIVSDSMLFHRGGYNQSRNNRRGISHMFTVPMIKQQISLPKALKGKYGDHPLYRQIIGYDCETADSEEDWRSKRCERANYT